MASEIEADVVIVGAGPTGLTTANALGMRGVHTIVIERNPGTVGEPRAVSIDDESLRIIQAIGLIERLLPKITLGYGARYYSPAHNEFARIKPTTREYGFPRRSAFHQVELEALLLDGLSRFPNVEILFRHTYQRFVQDAGGVTATVTDADGNELQIRARYLAACDGGSSTIRREIGVELKGTSFEERWLVIDCIKDDDTTADSVAYCDHHRPAITLPGPGNTRRWEFLLHPHEDAEAFITDQNIRDLLRPFVGDRPTEVIRKVVYTFHARVADHWFDGRVFLLGDAAHLTPPYAGQGMNSGQRDALNFAWKAAAVISGMVDPKIMSSYETERREHARLLIQMAIQIGWVMVPRNWFHTYGQIAFFKIAGLIPSVRNYFVGMKFKPKPRFSEGLVVADGRPSRNTLVGRMLPQPDVIDAAGERRKLDDVLGTGFALLSLDAGPEAALVRLDQPIWHQLQATRTALVSDRVESAANGIACVAAPTGSIVRNFSDYRGKVLLVRPDRYVAAAIDPKAPSPTVAALGRILLGD